MPVTDVRKDPATLSMTVHAEFAATPERVWRLWEDPRQLERWWGPPMYPAMFESLELRPGGAGAYYMTGPQGDTPRGWWKILATERPNRIEIEDGFADAEGNPDPPFPTTRFVVTIEPVGDRTRMEIRTTFPSLEAMEQMAAMGMEQGITEAVNQIDGILAADGVPA